MKKTNHFFTRRMYFALWTPAMLSSLGWAFSDMADAIVVGQKLGAIGLAAISLILPIYMVNFMFAHGFGLGGSVRYAHLLSQGDTKGAVECFNGVFWLSLAFGIATAVLGTVFMDPLLFALGANAEDAELYAATKNYLQVLVASTPLFYLSTVANYYLCNDGSQRRASIGSVAGNIVDIGLNVVFVLVLGMGTRGAALSTAVGLVVNICIYFPGFFGKKHTLHFARVSLRKTAEAFSALKAGLASSVRYLYKMIFYLVCNNLLIRLGGENTVAVFDVIQNTSYLFLYLFDGTGKAMQPIISTYHGEHNKAGMDHTMKLGTVSGMTVGGIIVAILEIWPASMCMLFGIAGSESEILALSALRIFGLSALFTGANTLICHYYQSCENEKLPFVMETLRGAALLIPVTFLCYKLGIAYFWLLFFITEAGTLLVYFLLRKKKRYRVLSACEDRVFQCTVLSNSTDIMDASRALRDFCKKWQLDAKQQIAATTTVEEVGMAILEHGFEGRNDGYIQITAISNEDGVLELHLRDDAKTFNPFDMKTNRVEADGDFDMDSMGMLIIKKRSKSFFYRRYQEFNTLIIKI